MFNPFSAWNAESRAAFAITRSPDNPVPFPEWVENLTYSNALSDFMNRLPAKDWYPDLPYYESLWQTPKAIRYQMNSEGRMIHPSANPIPWRVELARFSVPQRYFGIIRGFEQFMGVVNIQGGVSPLSSIGNPFADQDAGIQGRWYFRLFPFDGGIRPLINQLNPYPLYPGAPYSDFLEQSGLWFAAHSDSANNVRFIVPGGYELSAFWECGATITARPVIGACFKGGIQSALNDKAMDHYLGTWQ